MSLILSQLGAAPPPSSWRWSYARLPVLTLDEFDEQLRVSPGVAWHVSPVAPAVRFVLTPVVWQGADESDERLLPRWTGTRLPALRARPRQVQLDEGVRDDAIRPIPFHPFAHGVSASVRGVAVRGNHPTGYDDYEESWFG